MHAPNDESLHPALPEAPEPAFDGAEVVWDLALIRLYLETLARTQRQRLH
jgi:hypothetical protein